MTQGDKNNKFFHHTTLVRRRTNKIGRIRGSDGIWIQGEIKVSQEIHTFYQSLFTSDRDQGGDWDFPESVISCIPNQVSESMNSHLTGLATPEEVKFVTFQLGGEGSGTRWIYGGLFLKELERNRLKHRHFRKIFPDDRYYAIFP